MPSLRLRRRSAAPDLRAHREAPRLVAAMEQQAERVAEDEGRLRALLARAVGKLRARRADMGALRDDLPTLMRLVRAYARGEYRALPWRTLTLAVAALLYFVAPIDLIPDMLAGVGFVDDAAVVAYVLKAIRSDLAKFETWEKHGRRPSLLQRLRQQPDPE